MLLDCLFALSSTSIALLALAHYWFGVKAYIQGSSMGLFRRNKDWVPQTSKELALLGVFFITSFAWIQGAVLVTLLLLTDNPIGHWLGVINFLTVAPQYILLRRYIGWNSAAKLTFMVNMVVNILWFVQFT